MKIVIVCGCETAMFLGGDGNRAVTARPWRRRVDCSMHVTPPPGKLGLPESTDVWLTLKASVVSTVYDVVVYYMAGWNCIMMHASCSGNAIEIWRNGGANMTTMQRCCVGVFYNACAVARWSYAVSYVTQNQKLRSTNISDSAAAAGLPLRGPYVSPPWAHTSRHPSLVDVIVYARQTVFTASDRADQLVSNSDLIFNRICLSDVLVVSVYVLMPRRMYRAAAQNQKDLTVSRQQSSWIDCWCTDTSQVYWLSSPMGNFTLWILVFRWVESLTTVQGLKEQIIVGIYMFS